MVRLSAFLLFIVLVLGGLPARAASPWSRLASPVFVRPDIRELPEAAAMSLAQDRAGFVWVGTQGGLARFDGYHFRNFLPDASDRKALPDGYVRTIVPDAASGIWLGSSSNGLVHFDAASETFQTWKPDRNGRSGPRSASVDALLADDDGTLWVGGDGGLDRFDPRTRVFTPVALAGHGPQPVVWSVFADREHTVWAGTQDGLYARPAGAHAFSRFTLEGAARLRIPAIYSLTEDRAGRMWAGSVNTVFEIDRARRHASAFRSSPHDVATVAPGQQWSIIEIAPNVIWSGTDAQLSIVDVTTRTVRRISGDAENPGGLTSGRVMQFMRDRSGLVWLANHVGGLLLYNPLSYGLYEISATRPEIGFRDKGAVAVAALPNDRLWVGGFLGRLAEFDARSGRSTVLTLPNHAAIQTLLQGSNGTLWAGTVNGVCEVRPLATVATCAGAPKETTGESVYALLEDAGKLWVGGSAGLVAETIAGGSVSIYHPRDGKPLPNNQVRVLYRDRKQRLWIGTENGLDRLDRSGALTRFVSVPGNPDSLAPGGMATLFEDRRGRLWAGANGGPTDVLEEDRSGNVRFRHIDVANGMPHENVDGLAEDPSGRIWAATDKGIATIDPDTLRARAYGAADGVTDGAYWAGAVTQSADGTIFFGGLDGITVVAPDARSPWTYAPPVVVSSLKIGRKDVPAAALNAGDAAVDLPPGARDIVAEFAALDYSAPQSLRYSYRLDGYDRDWIEADIRHRVATYTNLFPGTYTLDVRATNRLGVWSERVLHVRLVAQPAWFETWWFRVLLALAVIGLAFAVYRLRTGVLRRRQSELETVVADRTRELSEANAKLEELSLSDPLTGLRNRRFLAQHLEADVAISMRRYDDWRANPVTDFPHDADLLFFLIDLDHLKVINDRHGHQAGDAVLIQIRDRLNEVFRESDFVVRWGGDEFLAVARGSRRSEAPAIAERVCSAVASRPFVLAGGQAVGGSVSVGFAAFPFVAAAPGTISWPHVVALADRALYLAKQAGRSTWFGLAASHLVDPAMLDRLLEHDAENAIQAGALEVLTRGTTAAI